MNQVICVVVGNHQLLFAAFLSNSILLLQDIEYWRTQTENSGDAQQTRELSLALQQRVRVVDHTVQAETPANSNRHVLPLREES